MYEAHADPYCYPGTSVLKNIPDIRDAAALERFETAITAQRAEEPLRHYQAIHRHLFQDVYLWAGRFRTVRIAKGESVFCYPENIPQEMRRVFAELRQARLLRNLTSTAFAAKAAHVLAELNAIHLFREGNGRVQLVLLAILAEHVGHPLDVTRLDREAYLSAIIQSFRGEERPLSGLLLSLVAE
jgi:cell filamentation protein